MATRAYYEDPTNTTDDPIVLLFDADLHQVGRLHLSTARSIEGSDLYLQELDRFSPENVAGPYTAVVSFSLIDKPMVMSMNGFNSWQRHLHRQ